jgi:hypothetical protein
LKFVLNGGIQTFQQAQSHLNPNGYIHTTSTNNKTPLKSKLNGNEPSNNCTINLTDEKYAPVHGVMIGKILKYNFILYWYYNLYNIIKTLTFLNL